MTIREARETAAAAWCDEPNRHTVMDVNLAESFANILIKVVAEDRRRIAEMVRGYYEGVNTYADPRVICRVLADVILNKH